MKKYKIILLTAGLVAVSAMSACQKNPEESIVKNKDFDKMVEQAKDGENGVSSPKDVAKENETYKNSFSDESLGVEVEIDATLDIPKTDKLAVYRVNKKKINQEDVNKMVGSLLGDDKLYDAEWTRVTTKKRVEIMMANERGNLEEVKQDVSNGYVDESELKKAQEEYKDSINRLKEQYESAPDNVSLDGYESDGKIHAESEDEERVLRGEIFSATNGGENGIYKYFAAQNNEDYGNYLCYRAGADGYISPNTWSVEFMIRGREGYGTTEFKEYELTISKEDAMAQAEKIMKEMGFDEYKVYSCDRRDYVEEGLLDCEYNVLDDVYVVTYVRNINGAFILPAAEKHEEGWQGDTYVKRSWPMEQINVMVSDRGVMGVDYCMPLEICDTVVEESTIKTFDEIKGIFENMVIPMYAEEDSMKRVKVDNIKLGYALISEKDNFDTGLLVPVWDFYGTIKNYDNTDKKTIMTINAIDGTIIDRVVGY